MSKAVRSIRDSEGRKLRQKLILLADRSDHGWEVVTKYEADELTKSSKDKKIQKAENET